LSAEPTRDSAVRSLCAALEIHALVEEEFFYPAVRQFGVNSTDLPALSKSQEEHDHMRELIKSVRAQDASVAKPVNAVMHHVADEETQPLALAERELEKERLA
jgi:iron-sulfur cluster repair protein YtfE (RIC family)